jgi:hypothetical protein
MSLSINPSLQEKSIFTTSLPFPGYQAVGYTDEGNFVIGKASIDGADDGIILESNNGVNWNQITYPESLGPVREFGSNEDGQIIVKLSSGSAYNNYFLSDIKNGSPYSILWSSSVGDGDYIFNRLGYFSYLKSSSGGNGQIYYKQFGGSSLLTYTVPYAGGILTKVTKSYSSLQNLENNFSSIYYTRSNWWGNYGTKNLFEIPGFTELNSNVFEAKDITGNITTRNLAFAFANNFTKILKINPSSTSVEPVFELIDCITPIPVFTGLAVQAVISNDGAIWANWGNPSDQTMLRLFSPNFGGEWFNLSSLGYGLVFDRFYSSSNGKNQLYSGDQFSGKFNPPISINYGR